MIELYLSKVTETSESEQAGKYQTDHGGFGDSGFATGS